MSLLPREEETHLGMITMIMKDGLTEDVDNTVFIIFEYFPPCPQPGSPVFPRMRSQGCSVTMLSSRGEMRGVRDHSLTVLSLLQLAIVNGRLG